MSKDLTCIIVDDEPANCRLLEQALSTDYETITCINGQECLTQSPESKPSIILLDVMMPDYNGYEVCKRIKSDEKTKDIPVIFLTAKTDEDSIEKAYEVGGVDYVTKPFKPKELISRVKRELQLKSLINNLESSNQKLESLAKENLDYASLMQQSLVPDEKTLLDCFGDFFVIQNKKDLVTSKNYLFIEINDNEFAYIMLDSQIDNVKSAFFTMMLNSIEKEVITSIKHKDHITVDSLWIYNYFVSAIKNKSQQGDSVNYPLAVVYYNKLDNKLKFTCNNASLWYTDNESYYSVESSSEVIEETVIDVQEEWEM